MKRLTVALLSAALLFALPALAQKKTLVVGMGSADAGKLDPHIASTTPDKGLLSWMFNGLVRMQARHDQPRVHRARSGRELDVESGRHRMDVQDPRRRPVPPRLRRIHRRRRRVLDQARQQQGDVLVLERLSRRRQGRGARQVDAEDHAEESGRRIPGLRRQRQRRQHDLQEGRRGDGRELREEADRHRPVHVRRVPAAAVRQAGRATSSISAARRRSTRSRIATSRPTRAATSRSSRASST